MRGTHPALGGFEVGGMGPWTKECVWPLESRNGLQLTASKEIWTSVLQPQVDLYQQDE